MVPRGLTLKIQTKKVHHGKLFTFILILLVVATYAILGNDSRHHWHEFRYLYSATHYTPSELMQGLFDPGPAPVQNPQGVAAWYSTGLLNVFILRQLVKIFGVGLESYLSIKAVYGVILIIATGFVSVALRNIGMSSGRALLIGGLVLVSPLSIYLGFKLMGEVPSLLFGSIAIAFFSMPASKLSYRIILSVLTGLALGLSTLASARMPLFFLGFWVALLLWTHPAARRTVLFSGLWVWVLFLFFWFIGFQLLGGNFTIYLQAIRGFLSFTKPLPMWIFALFNLFLFGMGLWLFTPCAWLSKDMPARCFFVVWFALSALPVLVVSVGFMEPRYLLPGFIPFVGVAALGFEGLWERLKEKWHASPPALTTLVAVFIIIMTSGSILAQYFIPYETNAHHLIRAVQHATHLEKQSVILIPWNYTDYHFLAFVFPENPVYLVQSAANDRGERVDDQIWAKKRLDNYGERFLPDAHALDAFSGHTMFYIGWTILPSLQNLRDFLLTIGFRRLASQVDPSKFMNHMTQSWLWKHPQFKMHEITRYGQYHVFEVNRTDEPFKIVNS